MQHVERLIAPAATILVRNAGVVSRGQSVERGLREMMEHPAWEAALRRGAKQVVMPMLDGVQAISALRVGIIDAMRGRPDRRPPLGPVARQLIALWLREMKESFAPVMETLGCGQEATDPVRVGRH
ncbi:hypothetical protein MPC1_2140007 [Methylocella tundrae]|nr:hypothetical protein MPC1_2140007 [Methylocella tundrae]